MGTNCLHEHFESVVNVIRLINEAGVVDGHMAQVHVSCGACGQRFAFSGVETGWSSVKPTTNFNHDELRIPIEPAATVLAD